MANNSIDEALKQASGEHKSSNNFQQKRQKSDSTHLLDERTDFKKIGFQDGLFMSADYQEGLINGLSCGIKEARSRTLKAINDSLKANREKKINFDYDYNPDHFLITEMPGLSIFALPPSEE